MYNGRAVGKNHGKRTYSRCMDFFEKDPAKELGAFRSQSKAIDSRPISKQMASGRDDDTALVYPRRQCLQITVGGWPIYDIVVSWPG